MSLLRGDGSRARRRCVISRRSTVLASVVACAMVTGAADASADSAPVGHRIENLVVPGSFAGENRKVRVHLWYPAAEAGFAAASKTQYTSGLNGKTLYPDLWDSAGLEGRGRDRARDGRDRSGPGAAAGGRVLARRSNDPIDYAWTLELIAAEGFIVAAPYHTNNSQDDARIDYINSQAAAQVPSRAPLFECEDGRPSLCARNDAPGRAASRTACATSPTSSTRCPAGSPPRGRNARRRDGSFARDDHRARRRRRQPHWGFGPEARVKAIMGLANGAAARATPSTSPTSPSPRCWSRAGWTASPRRCKAS